MSKLDLVSVGELLVDFTPLEQDGFQYNPGGGPANMVCMAAKLGMKTAFVGQVGADAFGKKLAAKLASEGVDVSALSFSEKYPTTLAFVHWAENGERSFSFYRHGGADTMLEVSKEALELIQDASYLFMSSVMMAEGSSRESCFQMMEYAKSKGVRIAFDPNLRRNLWDSEEAAKEQIVRALPYADVVKVSEEELEFITGCQEPEQGMVRLLDEFPTIHLVLVTLGEKGTIAGHAGGQIAVPSYEVKAIDTTGAGDAFMGAFLSLLIRSGQTPEQLRLEEAEQMVRFANGAGALTTTKKGGIDAQPSLEEILAI